MKPYWTFTSFATIILLLLTTSITNADEWSGHFSGSAGLKTMNSNDWPDLNKHFSMGFITDVKKNSWPISIALDIMDTGDKHDHDGVTDLGHTTELHLGVRKIIMSRYPKIQPYIGGGVSFMSAEQEYEETDHKVKQDDQGLGGWFGAGLYYEVISLLVVGLDVRLSYGEVTLFDEKLNAGGIYTGVTIGLQF